MDDIKWVKITTDMFDNRKIRHLRRLPEGNNIVLIWVMLLTMAGRCNAGGMVFLTETIPYTAKMLADELDFEESTVKLALSALEQLGMVTTSDNGYFCISGWEEYQNIEGMEKIRESKRLAQARWRAKKAEVAEKSTVDSTVDSTRISVDNADRERERERELDREGELDKDTLSHSLKGKTKEAFRDTKNERENRERIGRFQNVLLSGEEQARLKKEFPDWKAMVDRLSVYMASTGKTYDSHYATLLKWAQEDKEKEAAAHPVREYGDPEEFYR